MNELVKRNLHRDPFDEMLDDMFMPRPFRNFPLSEFNEDMKANYKKTETGYDVDVALPGYNKEDIDLNLIDGKTLIISAKHNEEVKDEHREFKRFASVSRTFHFDEDVKLDDVKAKLDKGVLRLELPFDKEKAEKKKIEIE